MHLEKVNFTQKLLYCLAILAIISWCSECFAITEISNVRHWTAPDQTRIVFDLSTEPDYQFKIEGNIITLEFSDASFHSSLPSEKKLKNPGISKILFTREGDNKCKIEIILKNYLTVEVFKLKKFMDKPDRVVVDIIMEEAEKSATVKERMPPSRKKRVIVLDPGHGGEDPGAVGKNGTYEKNVVLAISREIKKYIDKTPGYRAVLTRDGDYYVPFNKRLKLAKKTNASLFISVHADAAINRQAKGSSVYCLSTGAASNEAAKLLAKNENLSDIIGGVPNGEGNNQSDEIILNMFQTNTINLSKTFASTLIDQLGRVHCLKYPVFHEAPFRVLKLPDTPAVLLETAFISHAEEEQLLKKSSFRKTIASAITSSIANYFSVSSAVASTHHAGETEKNAAPILKKTVKPTRPMKTITYQLKRGDNLNAIAKQHETTLTTLLKLNQMKLNDPLYIGRKILIPTAVTESTETKRLKNYTVKKGDTLFNLAKSNAMTVDELRRLNHMTDDDVLWSGQKIKLPY